MPVSLTPPELPALSEASDVSGEATAAARPSITGHERGQRLIVLLAAYGSRVTAHIVERLGPELSGNAPLQVLCELALRGPLRPRDLLGPTGLTSAAMSKQLDLLEGLGLVTRTFGALPDDRRATLITLTDEGRRAAVIVGEAAELQHDQMIALRDELIRATAD